MVEQQVDELIHGFIYGFEKGVIGLGESGVSAVVLAFIPGAFENFRKHGGIGVVAFLGGGESELCEGAIRTHFAVVDASSLRRFAVLRDCGRGNKGERSEYARCEQNQVAR